MKGAFIVIEGTDGTGKGTQSQKLVKYLKNKGQEVVLFDFPQYDKPSSYFVQQYLNGKYGEIEEVGAYKASLFFALDRFDASSQIRKALEEGKIVVSNRINSNSRISPVPVFGKSHWITNCLNGAVPIVL